MAMFETSDPLVDRAASNFPLPHIGRINHAVFWVGLGLRRAKTFLAILKLPEGKDLFQLRRVFSSDGDDARSLLIAEYAVGLKDNPVTK